MKLGNVNTDVNCFSSVTGFFVISQCSANWCSIRCMGKKIFPSSYSLLHLCPNSINENKSMVSSTDCNKSLSVQQKFRGIVWGSGRATIRQGKTTFLSKCVWFILEISV